MVASKDNPPFADAVSFAQRAEPRDEVRGLHPRIAAFLVDLVGRRLDEEG